MPYQVTLSGLNVYTWMYRKKMCLFVSSWRMPAGEWLEFFVVVVCFVLAELAGVAGQLGG